MLSSSFYPCNTSPQQVHQILRKGKAYLKIRRFFIPKLPFLFIFLICCWHSPKALWRGASDEYPQHTFSWRSYSMQERRWQNYFLENCQFKYKYFKTNCRSFTNLLISLVTTVIIVFFFIVCIICVAFGLSSVPFVHHGFHGATFSMPVTSD